MRIRRRPRMVFFVRQLKSHFRERERERERKGYFFHRVIFSHFRERERETERERRVFLP